ncbi:hypothetical protein LTR17_007512 [Elasticomyces elasticus]|nr:hypothetical protein LTR17_007512 [Elasticomyces elasticus]
MSLLDELRASNTSEDAKKAYTTANHEEQDQPVKNAAVVKRRYNTRSKAQSAEGELDEDDDQTPSTEEEMESDGEVNVDEEDKNENDIIMKGDGRHDHSKACRGLVLDLTVPEPVEAGNGELSDKSAQSAPVQPAPIVQSAQSASVKLATFDLTTDDEDSVLCTGSPILKPAAVALKSAGSKSAGSKSAGSKSAGSRSTLERPASSRLRAPRVK